MPRKKKTEAAAEEPTPYVPRYLLLESDLAEPLELFVYAKIADWVYVVGVLTDREELSTVYSLPINHPYLKDITEQVEARQSQLDANEGQNLSG